jgi:hypothetical protein
MPPRLAFAALLFAACAGVEGDLRRAELRDGLADIVKGTDRGIGEYKAAILDSVTPKAPAGRDRYQYVGAPHLANYRVQWAVRGLGGTRLAGAAHLANVVDMLLFVLAHDPVPATRALCCEQLGRVALRLPLPASGEPEESPNAAANIHVAAKDLAALHARVLANEPVTPGQVVAALEALARETPPDLLLARQAVRALAAPPVGNARGGPVLEAAERLGPGVVRRAIVVALRHVACGDPHLAAELVTTDPSPIVRLEAARVLTRLRAPLARTAALRRLVDPLDPRERDADVRAALLDYVATVGDPDAFEVCVRRLDDVEPTVRLHAGAALVAMTGATEVPAEAAAWRAWRDPRPEWRQAAD